LRYHADAEYDVLYKYTSKVNAARMMNGNFRIGSLYEYQGIEDAEVGDSEEGFRIFTLDNQQPSVPQLARLVENYPHLGEVLGLPGLKESFPVGTPVQVTEIVPDCYMFCLTSKFDTQVMRRFNYDACLEIRHPKEFFFSLSRAMMRKSYFGAIRTCQYLDRDCSIETRSRHTPQVLKPKSYEHQQEVRFVWDPLPSAERIMKEDSRFNPNMYEPGSQLPEHPLKPVFIEQPEAAQYCHQIE
jgi:hypothetical protein